jgi:hypothetical protein
MAVTYLIVTVCSPGQSVPAATSSSRPTMATDASAGDLAGLWGCERSFGPEVRGQLTIAREQSEWRALIAGFDAPVRVDEEFLTFALPGDRGKFRGRVIQDGAKIRGHWIQPRTDHVWGSSYATPIELTATQDRVWTV